MENRIRNMSTHICEFSPLIVRLQPVNQYQSPWKYFPKPKKLEFKDRHGSVKKKKIMLQLPSIINKSQITFEENRSTYLNKKVFRSKIVNIRSLSPLRRHENLTLDSQ